jgi:hypothetical protein
MEGEPDREEDGDSPEGRTDALEDYRDELKRDIQIPAIMTKERRDRMRETLPNNTMVLRLQNSRTKPQKRDGGLNTPTHHRMPRDGLKPTRSLGPILQMTVRKRPLNTQSISPNPRVRTS